MRVVAGIGALFALTSSMWAQSRPETRAETRVGVEAVRPLMAKIRDGTADVETVRRVVEALLDSKDGIAAPWWIAEFEAVQKDEKLPAAEREALAKLKRACERHDAFSDERATILKVIRHAESLLANKDVEGARQAATIAEGMLVLVPDSALSKLLETVTKRFPKPSPEEPGSPKRTPWPEPLENNAKVGCRRLIDIGLSAYRDFGCRPGRLALARAIRAVGPLLGADEERAALAHLRESAKKVEPASVLAIFVRTVGTARFFRDGEALAVTEGGVPFEASTGPPLEFAALPGDTFTIAFDEPYSFDALGNSFVVALNARTESKDLGAKEMFLDVSEKPGQPGAKLYPLPLARKKPDPPKTLFGRSREQDDDLKRFNVYFELPKTAKRSVDVPCLGDMIGFGVEFDAKKLAPVWIGTEADHFAITIRVP